MSTIRPLLRSGVRRRRRSKQTWLCTSLLFTAIFALDRLSLLSALSRVYLPHRGSQSILTSQLYARSGRSQQRNDAQGRESTHQKDDGFLSDWYEQDFDGYGSVSEDRNKNIANGSDSLTQWQKESINTPIHQSKVQLESSVSSHFFSRKDLHDPAFYVDKTLFENLCKGANLQRPSKIQAMAWPILLQGKSAVVADQTGSGKTLAYLMPLIQRIKQNTALPKTKNGTPRILILAPTAELADQIHTVCNNLAIHVPSLTHMVVTATGNYNTSIRDQIRLIQRKSMDILVSTPGRIATILRTRQSGLDLSQLQALVLDEVDVLWTDETFGPQLRTIGEATPAEQAQFVFCTATLPDKVLDKVKQEFRDVVKIQGPGLHRIAPTTQERLVDVSVPAKYNRDEKYCFDVKAKALLQALRQTRCRHTIIFCNTVESCRKVENLLNRRDRQNQLYQVYSYHNAMTAESRNKNLASFAGRNTLDGDTILVCTDRAARGIDFEAASVDHVVIFDFPKDPAEYVRRVGRTARAGRTGTSTVLAYGWQLPIARSVMGKKVVSSVIEENFATIEDNDEMPKKRGNKGQQSREKDIIKEKIQEGKFWKEETNTN